MAEDTREICVTFPVPVEISRDHQRALWETIAAICDDYEKAHPDRVMWPAGFGGRVLWNEPNEPDFDMSVLEIECAERERYETDRVHQ